MLRYRQSALNHTTPPDDANALRVSNIFPTRHERGVSEEVEGMHEGGSD